MSRFYFSIDFMFLASSAQAVPRSKMLNLSDIYDGMSSAGETSSDEESTISTNRLILPSNVDPDDDVFEFGGIDICNDADSKLVDWSYNVFIPACKTLLYHCSDGGGSELSSEQILADLRSLSNTINYFCSEQQRLSGQLKFNVRGISSSLSTDRFHRLKDSKHKSKNSESPLVNGNTASMSSDSTSVSSGFEDSQYDRSYAVKILRSVSQSLIAPLLRDSEAGFTDDLYKSIVQAIQKIAWKVEACLSFNDPTKDFSIYSKIFSKEQGSTVMGMMIRALPPEEPKLLGHSSRSGSISVYKPKDEALLDADSSRVIRRTPSGRARPSGVVFDSTERRSGSPPETSRCLSGEYDKLINADAEFPTSPLGDLPQGRQRIATYASPQRVADLDKREFTESTSSRYVCCVCVCVSFMERCISPSLLNSLIAEQGLLQRGRIPLQLKFPSPPSPSLPS
jgi:hypothetical protein